MVKVAVLGLAAVFLSLIAGSVKREYAVAVMIGTAIYTLPWHQRRIWTATNGLQRKLPK